MALESGVYEVRFIENEAVVATGTFTLGSDSEEVGPVELQASATHLQWRSPAGTGAWQDLIALSEIQGPAGEDGAAGADGADGAEVEMRTSGDWIQWKLTTDASWKNLFDTSTISGGGTGDSTTIIVRGQAVTSKSMGFVPTGDPVTDTENLQTFIDNIATDRVDGYLAEGQWELQGELKLRDGLRMHGLGMRRTIINCDPANWTHSNYNAMEMDDVSNNGSNNYHGLFLSDFQVIGADKNRTDNGGLINVMGVEDFLIERLFLIDGSSYNLFVSGYGEGSFTNDITSDFWNSTFRGTVRDCLSYRGQIGFGTEGGAEDILFQRCRAIGNAGVSDMNWGLHGFRSASGYGITLRSCHISGYRQGVLLDRHKHIHIDGCRFDRVRNGIAPGSFYDSDPEITRDIRITNNYIQVEEENGIAPRAINDGYVGSVRREDGVVVTGNIVTGGPMTFSRSRQILVQGNIALDSGSYISCSGNASGLVANNLMNFNNSASDVVDGGNNNYIAP